MYRLQELKLGADMEMREAGDKMVMENLQMAKTIRKKVQKFISCGGSTRSSEESSNVLEQRGGVDWQNRLSTCLARKNDL